MEFEIPPALILRAFERLGARGHHWVSQVQEGLEDFAIEHQLEVLRQLPLGEELSVSYLVRLPDARIAALKAIENPEVVVQQASALNSWPREASVELLAVDSDRRLLLVEGLNPDRSLHSIESRDALTIACTIAMKLWATGPQADVIDHLPRVLTRSDGWDHVDTRLGQEGLAAASRQESSTETATMLHGDLHRGNVLADAQGTWKAIDPSPVFGPPSLEVAILVSDVIAEQITTPHADSHLDAVLDGAATALIGYNVSPEAIADWMLLHRLERIEAAPSESRDPSWDIEFADTIIRSIRDRL